MNQKKSLFFLVALSLLPFIVRSQYAPITTIGSAVACPNDTIILPVTAMNCPYINAISMELDYDATVLSFINLNPNNNPGNFYNLNPSLGNNIGFSQGNITTSLKMLRIGWITGATPFSVGNIAHLFDIPFRYYGGNTSIIFNNSQQYGNGGGECEYSAIIGSSHIHYIDTPTVNYYINGTVTQVTAPTQPGVINGYLQPVIGDTTVYSVANFPGTNYTWSAPSTWIGLSNTSSMTYIVGTDTGTIIVTPSNCSGSGTPRTLNIFPMNGNTIKGTLTYDNNACTPLDSAWMFLKLNGITLDSVQTDTLGKYQFNVASNGSYTITSTTHKPWGGVNSTDAVKVKRHFAGSELLTSSIRLHAADVNISLGINTTDAVGITRRFVGSDTSFEKGDWVFEKPLGGDTINVSSYLNDSIIINGNNIKQNFKGLCVGDVNGSNFPSQGAKASLFSKVLVNYKGVIRLSSNEFFDLPVFVTSNINISALSLIIDFPVELLKIEGIQLAFETEQSELFYKIIGNEIRIGWMDSYDFKTFFKGDTLFTIKLITSENFRSEHIINFKIKKDPLCEFADENGESIENVTLSVNTLEFSDPSDFPGEFSNISFEIYPNPSNDIFYIKLNGLTENSKLGIYNTFGQLINEFNLNSGIYYSSNQVEISGLVEGVYFIRLSYNNSFLTKKLVIIK